jgi:hypothetical protein
MRSDRYFVYLDYISGKGGAKESTKYHEKALVTPMSARHTIRVSHHGNDLRVSVDNTPANNARVGLGRSTGEIRVIMSGPIQVFSTNLSNTK